MDNVIAVSSGHSHTLAIRTDGSLWGWGANHNGQLGNGTATERGEGISTPIKIMENVIYVSAGSHHSMAIQTDGSLWAWGVNYAGWLGDGTRINRFRPVKIMEDVISVSIGSSHTVAITSDGSLWAWGQNGSGELGDGSPTHTLVNNTRYPAFQYVPVKVMDDVVAASAGFAKTMVIRTDGSLWAWGSNIFGLILPYVSVIQPIPTKVMDDVVYVSAGSWYAMVIRGDGSLWDIARGENYFCYMHIPSMSNIVSVSTNRFNDLDTHTIVLKDDGSLWTWGGNESGQLGYGTAYEPALRTEPIRIMENIMLPGSHTPQPIPTQTVLRFVIGHIGYIHNGTIHTADAAPFIDTAYNRSMLPLRIVAEAFGAEADWNSDTRTAYIIGAGVSLSLNIDTPLSDGMGIPIMVNDRIFVPVAYVAQQFGATTRWDGDAQAVYISLPNKMQ